MDIDIAISASQNFVSDIEQFSNEFVNRVLRKGARLVYWNENGNYRNLGLSPKNIEWSVTSGATFD